MLVRLVTVIVWSAVLASAALWGWRVLAKPVAPPAHVLGLDKTPFQAADLTHLLGAPPAAQAAEVAAEPEAATRFRLSGVAAARARSATGTSTGPGVAVLAFDGRPPRAYQVGDKVGAGYVLQAVGQRSATLAAADGASAFTLNMPSRNGAAAAPPTALPVPGRFAAPAPPPGDAAASQDYVDPPETVQPPQPGQNADPDR